MANSLAPLVVPVLTVLGACLHTAIRRPTRAALLELWVRWWYVGAVGVGALWVAVAFLAAPTFMADTIGFPVGNPFEIEIACANLGFAVAGIACAFLRPATRLVTAVGYGIFLWGAAIDHLVQYLANHNTAPGNWGGIIIADLAVPLVAVILAGLQLRSETASSTTGPHRHRTATPPLPH